MRKYLPWIGLLSLLVLGCDDDDCNCDGQNGDPDASTDAGPDGGYDGSGPLSKAAYDVLVMSGIFVEEGAIFTTSYNEGYNLNFEITEEEAASLLPEGFTPIPIRIIESDPEPLYYLSWYLAVINPDEVETGISRVDLFTYARNPKDELTLFFVASYMEFPPFVADSEEYLGLFKEIFDFFSMDTATGEPSYPHYYPEILTADHDTFKLVYGDSSIEARACAPLSEGEHFTTDFVMANSQIYRNAADKNVNYFNQSFVGASVETRSVDCVEYKNLEGFHPLAKNLRSIQFYGSQDEDITWYYEMCTNEVCGNPFK